MWSGRLRQEETVSAAPTSLVAMEGAAWSARWPALTSPVRLQRPRSTKPSLISTIPNACCPLGGIAHRVECSPTVLSPGRLFMLDFIGPPENRQAPVSSEEIEAVLRRVSGTDVRVKALESGSRWTDNTRLVDTYRRGRVLLAGDAAHVHSPFGGKGLSLGLVDAANLGWKLATVIRGGMPNSMLDTYTAERRPVAKAVLANTLAQIAIMRPDAQAGAMRDIAANLMQFDNVNRLIEEMMSGLSTRYDFGPELDDVGRLIGDKPINHGDSDVSLYDVMQDGMGVLLDAWTDGKVSKLVAASSLRIRCVAVDTGPSMLNTRNPLCPQ
jgi:FAD binding domain